MKNTSTKPLMPMIYFFPREECQIFIEKIHAAASLKLEPESIARRRSRQIGPAISCKYKERRFSGADA